MMILINHNLLIAETLRYVSYGWDQKNTLFNASAQVEILEQGNDRDDDGDNDDDDEGPPDLTYFPYVDPGR